jgi:hypothetical protein
MVRVRACSCANGVHSELFESIEPEALRGSFRFALPASALEQLLAAAIRLDVPAGAVVYRAGDAARTALVLMCLIRVYQAIKLA